MFTIAYYEDESGYSDVYQLMQEMKEQAKRSKHDRIQYEKTVFYLTILAKLGTRAGKPFIDHLKGDIWELRPLDNRLLFVGWDGEKFIILHHFKKRTQKTPAREIEVAEKRYKDLKERGCLR